MAEHFEVVQLQSSSRSSSAQTYNDCYHAAQQLFVVQSYGYYTEMFLTKISEEACRMFDFMLKHQLKKLLREIVLKFMMSDLELVFLSHFCRRDRWNIRSKLIENHSHIFKQHSGVEQDEDHRRLLLFIYLHSYNVKMYLGDKQTVAVLKNYLAVELDQWDTLYNLWLKECPVNTFNISPREINAIYNGYSKDCQVMEHKKNYNSIVDKILELSSTYTMMPASKKKLQKGEAGRKMVKLDSGIDEKNHSSSLRLSSKRSQLLSIAEDQQQKEQHEQDQPNKSHKKVTLRLKHRANVAVNSNVTKFFQANSNDLLPDFKPEAISNFFSQLDMGMRSLRSNDYESIPFDFRSNFDSSRLV